MRRAAGLPVSLLLVDLAVLAAIPGLLAAVHFGMPGIRELLVFDHGRVRGYTLLTTAYVHGSDAHLYSNLEAYVRIIWFPYLLSVDAGDRQWFYRVTTTLLLAVPVLVSLTNYLVLGLMFPDVVPITLGFSSVIAGFIGVYLVSIMRLVADYYSLYLTGLTGLVLAIEIIQIAAVRYDLRLTIGSVALLATAGLFVARRGEWQERISKAWAAIQDRTVVIQLLFVGLLAVNAGVYIHWLYPQPELLVRDTSTLNLVGHTTGLVCGVVMALAALRLKTASIVPESRRSRSSN